MKELIEALIIFMKYIPEESHPFQCEHDVLFVNCDPAKVSPEDKAALALCGFRDGSETKEFEHGFYSFRFGSC